jgi:hypothetical protein
VPKPAAKILRATAFITAVTDDYMLCGYKLYMGGKLVNVGPGRGEAPIWGCVQLHSFCLASQFWRVFCR